MNIGFSVGDAVEKRYSVRTFDPRPVEAEVKEKLLTYAAVIRNPLGPGMKLQLVEKAVAANGEKLGTYGVIKGASAYLCATIPKGDASLEALGYEFEQLVLYAAALGLGTCWLGGTFNRSAFAAEVKVGGNEIFPIVSPIGYPAEKKRISEQLLRRAARSNQRKPWPELFFQTDFGTPLSKEAAGRYRFPLEMLRLAPSAVNKQPWRVVLAGDTFHFFESRSLGGKKKGAVDLQRIDLGIGICHFHLAALEAGFSGRFERLDVSPLDSRPGLTYVTSWRMD